MNDLDVIRIRKQFGLTQEGFAKLLGCDRRTIINYEQGSKIPDSKVKLINMVLDDISVVKKNNLPTHNDKDKSDEFIENKEGEISELKDHISTLKQLIKEKDIINDYLRKEIDKLGEVLKDIRVV